jgi:hypothetical protein
MKLLLTVFAFAQGVMALLFALASLALMVIATREGWHALAEGLGVGTAQKLIEAVGLLAAAAGPRGCAASSPAS